MGMEATKVRVLLVEDEPAHAELIARAFESQGSSMEIVVASGLSHARRILAEKPCDLIIADWRLPDGEGVELLAATPEGLRHAVVIMTSHGNERVAVEALKSGALDYVVKSETTLLDMPHVAERALRQRQVEEALREREADLRRAAVEWRRTFDALPLGIVLTDADGRIVRANNPVLDWAGAAGHARLIGRRLEDLGGGEPWATLAAIGEDVRAGSPAVTREVRDALARRTWLVTGTSLGSQGEEAGWVILDFQDVTATSELKERLRQSETMAAVGAIVAGVAHEVRNPLFSISATVDAFESRYNREEYGPYLELLRSEIARLRGLMQDLLDLGRPPALEPGACVVLEVLGEAVRASTVLAQKRGVEVTIREENGPLEVFADRRRLVQVFQNLIDNAIHFSPPSGRVEVVAKGLGLGSERYVEVMVRDTGSGIRPEDLPRLFEPFFTRRQGGTGLGLPIVRRIVFDHEGEISAANHPDGGALLTVRLPVGS